MPHCHSRAHSWAHSTQSQSIVTEPRAWLPQVSQVSWFTHSFKGAKQADKNVRRASVPAITQPNEYLPLPYVQPVPVKARPVSMSSYNQNNPKMSSNREYRPLPLPLSLLPCRPSAVYNTRHELLRRPSSTALSFTSSMSGTPPLSPATPTSAHTYSTFPRDDDFLKPKFEGPKEESVYVLTLKTSTDIAQQMQMLRQKWFPADRLKVPAHVTLFHALPESKIKQASSMIESLSQKIKRFEISTGRIMKLKKGVLVTLDDGEHETRRIFVSLRTSWWEWLSAQDKNFKAHWTVQNKEENPLRVDEAYRDTHRLGSGMGWATGLVLWKYESDGKWTKEREFDFARSAREQFEVQEPSAPESDGWPVF